MRIILLGPPGAGKGSQGELLARRYHLPRLSVGAILRRVWKEKGEKSEEIGKYMTQGLNVPAKLLFEVLTPWFVEHEKGFIVDNLPRNLDQLEEFKKFLKRTGINIDKVFHLVISDKEAIARVTRRHKERMIAGNGRPDEEPSVIKKRIEEGYKKEIKPIIEFFKTLGILVEINGEQSVEEVYNDILNKLTN